MHSRRQAELLIWQLNSDTTSCGSTCSIPVFSSEIYFDSHSTLWLSKLSSCDSTLTPRNAGVWSLMRGLITYQLRQEHCNAWTSRPKIEAKVSFFSQRQGYSLKAGKSLPRGQPLITPLEYVELSMIECGGQNPDKADAFLRETASCKI